MRSPLAEVADAGAIPSPAGPSSASSPPTTTVAGKTNEEGSPGEQHT